MHWVAEHATYFITFNLHDAIPHQMRERVRCEADQQIARLRATRGFVTAADIHAIEAWSRHRLECVLDEQHGSNFMRRPDIAQIVADALLHFDGTRYEMLCWCVMPNHVHVVARLRDAIDHVVKSWKNFSASEANRHLDRIGAFWQSGYHDRCIRDEPELTRRVDYVLNNPPTAGLRDWPFVEVYSERLAALA